MSFSTRWVREAIPASDGMVPVNLFPLSSRISSALREDIKGVKVPDKPMSVKLMLVTRPEQSQEMPIKVPLQTSPPWTQDGGGLDNCLVKSLMTLALLDLAVVALAVAKE